MIGTARSCLDEADLVANEAEVGRERVEQPGILVEKGQRLEVTRPEQSGLVVPRRQNTPIEDQLFKWL